MKEVISLVGFYVDDAVTVGTVPFVLLSAFLYWT